MGKVRVTESQADRLLGKQRGVSTSASLNQYRRDFPEDCTPSPPGYAATHVLEDALGCRKCGRQVNLLVQCYGDGPCATVDWLCLACGEVEKQKPRKQKVRPRVGKRSRTPGTDLG